MEESGIMHREERKVYFSNPELFKALASFCDATNLNFPFSDKANLSFRTEDELIATISDPDQDDAKREFLESEVAVALILLCGKMNIPVARRAEKSIELSDEHIILVTRLSDETSAD